MRSPRILGPGVLTVLALCLLLPLAAAALRADPGPRCALDGVTLVDAPVVRITEAGEMARGFCCVGCAARWIAATGGAPDGIVVTDAVGGRMIDAREAWFVRSSVLSQPATRDRVHAFASEEAAREHAKTFRGRLLTGAARPFGAAE